MIENGQTGKILLFKYYFHKKKKSKCTIWTWFLCKHERFASAHCATKPKQVSVRAYLFTPSSGTCEMRRRCSAFTNKLVTCCQEHLLSLSLCCWVQRWQIMDRQKESSGICIRGSTYSTSHGTFAACSSLRHYAGWQVYTKPNRCLIYCKFSSKQHSI